MTRDLRRTVPEVIPADETPNCPRCHQESILAAWVPDQLTDILNVQGGSVWCRARVLLCPTCDMDNPHAAPLLTFFAVHGTITDETVDEAAPLLLTWLRHAEVPRVDPQALEEDLQAWRRGEFEH